MLARLERLLGPVSGAPWLCLVAWCLVGTVLGCSSEDDGSVPNVDSPVETDGPDEPDEPMDPGEGSNDPMVAAYTALEAADYAAVPELIARLDAAFEEYPDRGRLAFYAGTMRLWLATGGPRALGDQYNDVVGAIEKFEQALALRPEDPHVNAFLGIAQVALGDALGDDERIGTGRQVLADGIQFYPPYVNGVRTQAFGMLPRDHEYFPEAVDAMSGTFEACGFDASDAADLTITYPSPDDSPLSTCWNGGVVDHVWEGIFLIYGDVLVKSGDPDKGRALYEIAKQSPTFDTWLFGDELSVRIAGADERAHLYLDDDPANDPPTWMEEQNLCVGCHASKP